MNRIIEIMELDDNRIDYYINTRVSELNASGVYEDISLSDDEGNIYSSWINTDIPYLPSGYRSKGFKIDNRFIKDFIIDTRDKFSVIPLERLKERLTEDMLIKWFNMYVINYFGPDCDTEKRKEIYGYGLLNSIGETLDISEIKGLKVAECMEKSAALNQILNFLDIDSSLVLSDANEIGHAYCLVNTLGRYYIVDPSFYGKNATGKGIPYIFEIDPSCNSCSFDPSVFGDEESQKINYNFPSNKFKSVKKL